MIGWLEGKMPEVFGRVMESEGILYKPQATSSARIERLKRYYERYGTMEGKPIQFLNDDDRKVYSVSSLKTKARQGHKSTLEFIREIRKNDIVFKF